MNYQLKLPHLGVRYLLEDIFDAQFIESISKLAIALLLSGLIGFERELNKHSAGFRTHILVGISSCLMMLLSINGFDYFIENYDNIRFDPARIPSYVISGIGFLGAGTIIVNGGTIRGLTTAASIWAVAGLGLIIGIGMYKEAIVTTVIILVSLVVLNKWEKQIHRKRHQISFEIKVAKDKNTAKILEKKYNHFQLKSSSLTLQMMKKETDGLKCILMLPIRKTAITFMNGY